MRADADVLPIDKEYLALLLFVLMELGVVDFAYGRLKINIGCDIIRAANRNLTTHKLD